MLFSRVKFVKLIKLGTILTKRGYKIHPAVGIARLGNSTSEDSYLEPTTIGGIPKEVDGSTVRKYKNAAGQIKRQIALFTVYDDNGNAVKMNTVASVSWKCWLANKKPVWYTFDKYNGDLMLGENNSYEKKNVPMNNRCFVGDRKGLIVDPGPKTVSKTPESRKAYFDDSGPNANFPADIMGCKKDQVKPELVTTLGDMEMTIDDTDNVALSVRGGFGKAGGIGVIGGFEGADDWFDDISDGPIECHIDFDDGNGIQVLKAWVVVGSPKYAPGLVNISTWDDTTFDVAVRFKKDFAPAFVDYSTTISKYINAPDAGYEVNIKLDIEPILERMRGHQWVSNIGSMIEFASPRFDIYDNDKLDERKRWFNILRTAIDLEEQINVIPDAGMSNSSHQQLFVDDENDNYLPLMPLQPGSGSVQSNVLEGHMEKFTTMTPTQYYMLRQWAYGRTSLTNDVNAIHNLCELDRAAIGNCVGYPQSPGIEVTWSTRNPIIYDDDDVYRIVHYKSIEELETEGLNAMRDECDKNNDDPGCQPGDLTKRMAIPWQADFAYCTYQTVNFTKENQNRVPVQYYGYWWPVQAPYNVYASNFTEEDQANEFNGIYSGQQVNYQRGIESAANLPESMLQNWNYLGFIVNVSKEEGYNNYVETERNLADMKYLDPNPAPAVKGDALSRQAVDFSRMAEFRRDHQ